MEEFLQNMIDKVGIARASAENVLALLDDHAGYAVTLRSTSGLTDRLPGGLGDKLGGRL